MVVKDGKNTIVCQEELNDSSCTHAHSAPGMRKDSFNIGVSRI